MTLAASPRRGVFTPRRSLDAGQEILRIARCIRLRPAGEVIVYDECSFPAEDIVPKNASIKIIRGAENRGSTFGRNRLLEQAGADVHFHDSDDFSCLVG